MDKRPDLHCLWIGRQLGWSERLCLSSWLAHGHAVTLWAYEPIDGVPAGVTIAPADQILPRARIRQPFSKAALISDHFRFRLLRSRADVIWLDLDVLLLRPFDITSRYVFGWEDSDLVCTAVMRLPSDSPVLGDLLTLIEARAPVPPWWPRRAKLRQLLLGLVGRHERHEVMRWGTFGPKALTEFLRRRQMTDVILPAEVFYPIHWKETDAFFVTPDAVTPRLTEATIAVHLWNKIIGERAEGAPPRGSWLDAMCRRYGVAAPEPSAPAI